MATHAREYAKDVIDQAVGDPAAQYGTPANVLRDERLSTNQKRLILESWALDQKRLMESEDENMTQIRKGHSSAAVLYQDILEATHHQPH